LQEVAGADRLAGDELRAELAEAREIGHMATSAC